MLALRTFLIKDSKIVLKLVVVVGRKGLGGKEEGGGEDLCYTAGQKMITLNQGNFQKQEDAGIDHITFSHKNVNKVF